MGWNKTNKQRGLFHQLVRLFRTTKITFVHGTETICFVCFSSLLGRLAINISTAYVAAWHEKLHCLFAFLFVSSKVECGIVL